jgi:fido (protein-threonine AMPylation protein)
MVTSLDKDRFVSRLSRYWGAANEIHSFREGNTRSQLVFFHDLARNAGYDVGCRSCMMSAARSSWPRGSTAKLSGTTAGWSNCSQKPSTM